jgi:hypothetical protein
LWTCPSSFFCLNQSVAETEFCLQIEVQTVQFGEIHEANVCFRCCCSYLEAETDSVEWVQLSKFHLKKETESSLRIVVLNKKTTMGMPRIVIFILKHYRHKRINLIGVIRLSKGRFSFHRDIVHVDLPRSKTSILPVLLCPVLSRKPFIIRCCFHVLCIWYVIIGAVDTDISILI